MDTFCACGAPSWPQTTTSCASCGAPVVKVAAPDADAPQGATEAPTYASPYGPPTVETTGEPIVGYGPAVDGAGAYVPASTLGQYAPVGVRIGAYAIDFVFLAILSMPLNMIVSSVQDAYVIMGDGPLDAGVLLSSIGLSFLSIWVGIAAFIAYFVVPTALKGVTLGKLMLGLQTVRDSDGALPGWGKAFGRYGLLYLMNMPCYIPSVICAVFMRDDMKTQGWHDRAAGTVVIRTR